MKDPDSNPSCENIFRNKLFTALKDAYYNINIKIVVNLIYDILSQCGL